MIREVLAEAREGYRYPDDMNPLFAGVGLTEFVEPTPSRAERVARAIDWGVHELLEQVAAKLEPRSA